MEIQIEKIDGKNFKLTVAKDRVSIKVPKSSDKIERDNIVDFLTYVAKQIIASYFKENDIIGNFTQRGTFNKAGRSITMTHSKVRVPIKKYYYDQRN